MGARRFLSGSCAAALLAGCGGAGVGSPARTVTSGVPEEPTISGGGSPAKKPAPLTVVDARKIRASIRGDRFVREVAGDSGHADRTETGYEVTKAELIGPAPTNPAYAPDPGR